MSEQRLTHLDPLGNARMVDVTPKEPTARRAVARGRVHMSPETTSLVAQRAVAKGDVLAVARIAGIQAAKRASDLLPLCHPVMVGAVLINFELGDDYIELYWKGFEEGWVDAFENRGKRGGAYSWGTYSSKPE